MRKQILKLCCQQIKDCEKFLEDRKQMGQKWRKRYPQTHIPPPPPPRQPTATTEVTTDPEKLQALNK